MDAPRRHRFRPAHPALAWVSAALGATLCGWALAVGAGIGAAALGAAGLAAGALYLASPAWRTELRLDDGGIEVLRAGAPRFRLDWSEIVRVVAARDRPAAFIDGGDPARSILLPGAGARAAYRIEDQAGLLAAVRARVPADRIQEVDRLTAAVAR